MSIILRSYREVWRDALRAEARPDQVTRLPLRRIGAKDGVYVITGARHEEAARYMTEQLAADPGLAAEIVLAGEVEDVFGVAVDVEYPGVRVG